MPQVDLLYEQMFRRAVDGNIAVRRYFVSGLAHADDVLAAQAAGLPKIGDVLVIGTTQMTVSAVSADEIVKSHTGSTGTGAERFFTVQYRSGFGYGSIRNVVSRGPQVVNNRIDLPNWTGSAGSGTWKPIVTPIKRGYCQIVKTSYVTIEPANVEFFLQNNQGRLYTINGRLCLLDGFRSLASESTALMVETYFRSALPVRGYAANFFVGQSIPIPELDYLEDYRVVPPNPETGSDPDIGVISVDEAYEDGDPFPWTL